MDVLCVGQLVTDVLVNPIDSIDFKLDTKRVDRVMIKNGGDCMNTAIDLAKLGNSVGFAGKVGGDVQGRYLTEVMQDLGIDLRGLVRDENGSTATVVVLINSAGERVFMYYGGTNETFCYENIDLKLLDECKIVHVGGTYLLPKFDGEGAARLFELAHAKGKLTSMDVTWDVTGRWLEVIRPCLRHLDYFMPSINEASHIAGTDDPKEIARVLRAEGVGTVVVKLGSEGCYVQGPTGEFFSPAYKVPVVDTTGAGDSFVAGFLSGLTRGWELPRCALFAAATASFCIQQVGATTGVPVFDDVIGFMNKQ